jgi:recombinational DNA repair protein RecT
MEPSKQKQWIEKTKNNEFIEAFKGIIPKDAKYTEVQFMAIVRNELLANEKLAQCTNLVNILYDIASAGLMLGSMYDEAYIIPYKDKATFIAGYRGYVKKYNEAGYRVVVNLYSKSDVEAGLVYYNEKTDLWYTKKDLSKDDLLTQDNIAGGVIKLYQGNNIIACEQMSINEIKEVSKTKQWDDSVKKMVSGLSNVWSSKDRSTDFGEMAKKALIRRVSKRVSLHSINFLNNIENKFLKEKEEKTSKIQDVVVNVDNIEIPEIDEDGIVKKIAEENKQKINSLV